MAEEKIIAPAKAEAKYENGLLRIMAPFKDAIDGAVEIKVT